MGRCISTARCPYFSDLCVTLKPRTWRLGLVTVRQFLPSESYPHWAGHLCSEGPQGQPLRSWVGTPLPGTGWGRSGFLWPHGWGQTRAVEQPAQPTLGTSAAQWQCCVTELEAASRGPSKPRLHVRGPRGGLASARPLRPVSGGVPEGVQTASVGPSPAPQPSPSVPQVISS